MHKQHLLHIPRGDEFPTSQGPLRDAGHKIALFFQRSLSSATLHADREIQSVCVFLYSTLVEGKYRSCTCCVGMLCICRTDCSARHIHKTPGTIQRNTCNSLLCACSARYSAKTHTDFAVTSTVKRLRLRLQICLNFGLIV